MHYNVAVVAGGDSGEYEISLRTGDNIYQNIDRHLFHPYLLHFKGDDWHYTDEIGHQHAVNKNDFSITVNGQKIRFDVVFIAIHGTPGENGKLQSYLEMIGQPYTGCGSFCSALTFNKYYCNLAVTALGVPVMPSLHFYNTDIIDADAIEETCGYPCFVKSCNSGSSVGVVKVHNRTELDNAFAEAFKYDNQLITEKFIRGRELSCGVTSAYGKTQFLAATEVVANNEFYDYDAKYSDTGHRLITPARLPEQTLQLLKEYSEKIFYRLNCKGVVRIDFILSEDDNVPYFLEVNTIPGETVMSIIPKQVQYNHLSVSDFFSKMILEVLNP